MCVFPGGRRKPPTEPSVFAKDAVSHHIGADRQIYWHTVKGLPHRQRGDRGILHAMREQERRIR